MLVVFRENTAASSGLGVRVLKLSVTMLCLVKKNLSCFCSKGYIIVTSALVLRCFPEHEPWHAVVSSELEGSRCAALHSDSEYVVRLCGCVCSRVGGGGGGAVTVQTAGSVSAGQQAAARL